MSWDGYWAPAPAALVPGAAAPESGLDGFDAAAAAGYEAATMGGFDAGSGAGYYAADGSWGDSGEAASQQPFGSTFPPATPTTAHAGLAAEGDSVDEAALLRARVSELAAEAAQLGAAAEALRTENVSLVASVGGLQR